MNAGQPKTAGLERCLLTGNIYISHAQSVKHTVSHCVRSYSHSFQNCHISCKELFQILKKKKKIAPILPCYRNANRLFLEVN